MKKRYSILVLLVIMCITFTGCNSSKKVINVDNATEADVVYNNYKSDEYEYDKVKYQVTNVGKSKGNNVDKPSDGKEYIIVSIKITNTAGKDIKYNALDWKLVDSSNKEDAEAFTIINNETSMGSGTLESGKSIEKTIAFEKKLESSDLKLRLYKNVLEKSPSVEIPIK